MLAKKTILHVLALVWLPLWLRAQDIQSSFPVVLPNLSQSTYTIASGQSRLITSSQSVTLLPGTHFQAGSNVNIKIALQPGTTGNAPLRSYVQQEILKVSGITTDAQLAGLTAAQKQTIRYYTDGMGRIVQTVALQSSPQQHDIVQINKYDAAGRQTISYLPYVSANGNGNFRPNAFTEQVAFYSNGPQDKVADDPSPYSQQVFDNSPLQRLLQAGTVGAGFQPGQHAKTMGYRANAPADNVMQWGPEGTLAGSYAAGLLNVTQTTDEQGAQVTSFTNYGGQLVLKRQLANEVIGGITQTYFDTYYVYNNAGGINYVIPPKATALIVANNYPLTQPEVSRLLFVYKYDDEGRLTEKTVPGATTLYIVYDPLNRPVLLQDGNLRAANKWNYIKYDAKNRAVSQGFYTDNSRTTLAAMQAYINTLDYSTAWYESRSTGAAGGYYTNNIFPTQSTDALAYSYYDDYDLDNNGTADYNYQTQGLAGEAAATSLTRGMLTLVRQKTVGAGLSATWLIKIMFYDKQGTLIQTRSNNQLNATVNDSQTQAPDFTGKPLQVKTVKVTAATTTVLTTYNYDHADRITAVEQSYNGAAAIRVAGYNYNELGQLVDKQLHSVNGGASFLQSVDYRYSIRGQLLSLNNSTLTNDGGTTNDDSNDVFGMQLLYNQTEAGLNNAVYYNGMVSAVKWIARDGSSQPGRERSYRYNYDALQRLKDALYADRPLTGGAWANQGGFDEKEISYDAAGNILALQRNALISGTVTPIDALQYSYEGNRLNNVADGTGGSYTALGFKNITGSATVFTYDDNGSLLSDPKKGISLAYNLLGKTDRITITSAVNRYLTYTYNADGSLLRKQQYDAGTLQKTTDYIDGFVYENNALAYFAMPEGRVRSTGSGLKSEYIINDQQGNARISFEDNAGTAKVVQENSYYAFGLVMSGSVVSTPSQLNRNLYNGGSEWQNDFGDLPDLYETFYRSYDAALGRWTSIDPKAEAAESLTPYQYANNNPVMYNDPLGDISQDQWDAAMRALHDDNIPYGLYANNDGGMLIFGSSSEAFYYAARDIELSGGWGNTTPGSYMMAAANMNIHANAGAAGYANVDNHVNPLMGTVLSPVKVQYGNSASYFTASNSIYNQATANQGGLISDPSSWVFTTSKTNGNIQTAGVSGIDKWFFEARFINWNDIKLNYGHVTLPTLYLEYPKITNMFFKKNEVLSSTFAALIMARATDRAIQQTSDWFYKQENPGVWDTKIEFMKNLTQQVLRDGGRVTTAPNYAPVIVTPYRRL